MSLAARPVTVLLMTLTLAAGGLTLHAQRGGGAGTGNGTQPPRAPRPTLPPVVTLTQITWLSGNWRSTEGGLVIEERWTIPAGGAMLGVSRTIKGNQMIGFEFLRIVERGGKLVYIAQPGGQLPVEFTMTGMNENSAVFENPMHDFPKIITYTWRDDGTLQAVVGDGPGQQTFEFTRSPQ